MTQQNCLDEFDKFTKLYVGIAYAVLAVNVTGYIFAIVWWYLSKNPKHGMRLCFSMAVMTGIFGITMMSLLFPSCPEECGCQRLNGYLVLPFVLLAISKLWLFGGIAYYKNAASTYQQHGKTAKQATVVLAAFEVDAFEQDQGNTHHQQLDVESGGRTSTVTTVIPVVHKKKGANV